MSKLFYPTLLTLSVLLAACNPVATPTVIDPTTAVPTLAPTNTPVPSPVPPTVTVAPPTNAPSTAAPTTPAPTPPHEEGDPIPALAANTPLTLTTINMQDATTGWAVGKAEADPNDHVLRTSDGGTTWQDVTPPQNYDPAETLGLQATAWFADADQAWVIYADRDQALLNTAWIVWHTSDGGQSWAASTPLVAQEAEMFWPDAFAFADAQHGWLLVHAGAGMSHDYVFVYGTQDGGATWEVLVNPFAENLPMGCYKNGIGFIDAQAGWITGDCGGVSPEVYFYHTADGGQTWNSVPLTNPTTDPNFFENNACRAQDLQLFAPTTLRVLMVCMAFDAAGTRQGWLYGSEDGGATWHFSAMPMGEGTLTLLTPTEGWFLGSTTGDPAQTQYQLFHTTDGGQNWLPGKKLGWTSHLDWVDATTAFGIAHSFAPTGEETLALVKTTNSGQGWQLLTPKSAP